jgi:hypothetical protein
MKRKREVGDAIWTDSFKTGDYRQRVDAVRRGDLPALIRLGIRID